jgi:hypothetical protein
MHVFHRSAAVLVALLLAALPASATLIHSSALDTTYAVVRPDDSPLIHSYALDTTSAVVLPDDSPLIEFDVEDWLAFISSDTPEYPLSSLGSGIDAFGGPSEFQLVLSNDFDDEPILTQVWNRP